MLLMKEKKIWPSELYKFGLNYIVKHRVIERSNCFNVHGHDDPCHVSSNPYMIIFGVVQILLSQIPDFDKIWWLSIIAAVMSFTYSTIGLGLGIAKAAGLFINHSLQISLTHVCF